MPYPADRILLLTLSLLYRTLSRVLPWTVALEIRLCNVALKLSVTHSEYHTRVTATSIPRSANPQLFKSIANVYMISGSPSSALAFYAIVSVLSPDSYDSGQ